MIIKLQPAAHTDHLTEDGQELTQRPYPFHVTNDGAILDRARMGAVRAVGFTDSPSGTDIVLWWRDAVQDPQSILGRYLVTGDAEDAWSIHQLAIATADIIEQHPEDDPR